MYSFYNHLQIHTIPTFIGIPILNGSIKWKYDYNVKTLNIHLDYQIQMNSLEDILQNATNTFVITCINCHLQLTLIVSTTILHL